MLKSLIIYFAIPYLVLADVRTEIRNNEILLLDTSNNFTEITTGPTANLPYINHDIGDKRFLNIVVSPVIHNVAQGFGPGAGSGDKVIETSTYAPVTTTTPPEELLSATFAAFFRKTRFLIRFVLKGIGGLFRGLVRFIMCTFVPICGLFGVFGDEPVDESLVSPQGVARGLDFIGGFIENYNAFQNALQQ